MRDEGPVTFSEDFFLRRILNEGMNYDSILLEEQQKRKKFV